MAVLEAILFSAVLLNATQADAQRGVLRPPPGSDVEVPAEPAPEPVPPRLLEFIQAEYPPAMLEEGVEATVVLRIEIDESGGVTGVEVVDGAGRGFDEAAMAAARRFRFSPARIGDAPVASRILYRYRFEVRVEEPLEPETIMVPGLVTDVEGVPIEGATVVAAGLDDEGNLGEPVVVTSNAGGRFEVGPLLPGRYEMSVTAAGFVVFRGAEPVELQEGQDLTFRLEREGAQYETVIRARRPGQQLTTRTIDAREAERVPGASGDPLRVIQNMPGMNRMPFGLGVLVVRGQAPGDTRVLLESVDIPMLYHFGGLNSVINQRLLESIDFMPGNYPARYGNVHGGIVEVRLRELQRAPYVGWHGELSVDIIDAELALEGPITEDLAFAVAARRSYIDAVAGFFSDSFDGISISTAPAYWDWQAVLQWTPSSRHFLRVIGFGSDDRVEIVNAGVGDQGLVLQGAATSVMGYNGALLQYRYRPDGPVSFNLTAAAGQNRSDAAFANTFRFDVEEVIAEVRPEVVLRAGDWGRFLFGARLSLENQRADVQLPDFTSPAEGFGAVATRPFEESTRFSPRFYAEAQLRPLDALTLTPGIHVDVNDRLDEVIAEPRFWMRYQLLEGTALEGGVGVYHQEPNVLASDPFFGNPDLGFERSVHYGIGLEQHVWGPISLTLNGFYKQLDRLAVSTDEVMTRGEAIQPLRFTESGEGRIFGLEALVRVEPTERFFGWISYTLMRSERRDDGDSPWSLFAFDQTHLLTVVAGVRLPRDWEIGLRFQLATGRPTTPVVGSVYQADIDAYSPVQGELNSERMPLFHQLDLRIDKTWEIRDRVRVSLYLDVQNVYYNRNIEFYSYSFDYSRRNGVSGLPILPNLGLSVEF